MPKPVATPCVGICSSGIGDDVCRGCKRFAHEVIDWNAYTSEERQLIQQRLDNFLTQIITLKIDLFDKEKLCLSMKARNIPFDDSRDSHLWAYEVIKARPSKPLDPEIWGFKLRSPLQSLSSAALHESIEKEFYDLSTAYYERYVRPGIVRGSPG